MTFNEYQNEASKTDFVIEGDASEVIPLLGLAGEVGELVSEYKKYLREGGKRRKIDLTGTRTGWRGSCRRCESIGAGLVRAGRARL